VDAVEYVVFELHPSSAGFNGAYKPEDYIKDLNKLGAQGWRLVGVLGPQLNSSGTTSFLLMRERQGR
jgi:hypothetical protein